MGHVRCIDCDASCEAVCISGEPVLLSDHPDPEGRWAVRNGHYAEVIKDGEPIAYKDRFARVHERDAQCEGLIRYADHKRQACKKSFAPVPEKQKPTRDLGRKRRKYAGD